MFYFIYNSGDRVEVESVTDDRVLERVNEVGADWIFTRLDVLEQCPDESVRLRKGKVLITKGEVVEPKPVRTVTEYKL